MQLRVTTLAENTATKMGALAEHGLSMLELPEKAAPMLQYCNFVVN